MDELIIFLYVVSGIITFAVVALLICFFMMRRNNWVYKQRSQLHVENYGEYKKLISYEEMFKKFWIWDIEKLKRK